MMGGGNFYDVIIVKLRQKIKLFFDFYFVEYYILEILVDKFNASAQTFAVVHAD